MIQKLDHNSGLHAKNQRKISSYKVRRRGECSLENQSCFFILLALWRGTGDVTTRAGADGAGVKGAGADGGLPRQRGCWEVTG